MFSWLKRLARVLRHGESRFLPWYTIGRGNDTYLTRVYLTPRTPWGQGLFHIFHRGDGDPDPHDHPWSFWTFPFTTYEEEVLEYVDGKLMLVVHRVEAWKWHHRKATHIHRVLGAVHPFGYRLAPPFCTVIWTTGYERPWGFWPKLAVGRTFIKWKAYFKAQEETAPLQPDWYLYRQVPLTTKTYKRNDLRQRLDGRDPWAEEASIRAWGRTPQDGPRVPGGSPMEPFSVVPGSIWNPKK